MTEVDTSTAGDEVGTGGNFNRSRILFCILSFASWFFPIVEEARTRAAELPMLCLA
jgi:hypothetical protein